MSESYPSPDKGTLLLVDDQPANLDVLCRLLKRTGYNISVASRGPMALKLVSKLAPDLILLDVMMPEMDGYEVCRRLKADPDTAQIPVIFITARDQTEGLVTGFEAGGVDYITKPFHEREVLVRVQTQVRLSRTTLELRRKNEALEHEIAQRKALKNQLNTLSEREAERWGLAGFVGHSPTIKQIFKKIRLVQESATTSVLVTGESGTGKELIARAIHFDSPSSAGPFVPLNCAALPAELIESLLFGHVKGAFTGAEADRVGYFEMATGGTLFLDEMGDMPAGLQAKLLRVLEDGEILPIGATQSKKVAVRVVAATNADLRRHMQAGTFRQDLYFRLARFEVELPPLRQRREDIPLLAAHFLELFASEMGREPPVLSEPVLQRLNAYDFPGNVRELKNIIERALLESGGQAIRTHHLHFLGDVLADAPPPTTAEPAPELSLDEAVARTENLVVERAMARADGNISEAARLLGSNRNKLYRILGQSKGDA